MRREVTGTMWVLVTLVSVVILACIGICVLGLVTYEVTGSTR